MQTTRHNSREHRLLKERTEMVCQLQGRTAELEDAIRELYLLSRWHETDFFLSPTTLALATEILGAAEESIVQDPGIADAA